MGIIEEIKRAEAEAERLKREAEKKGQELVEGKKKKMEEQLRAFLEEKENLKKEALTKANAIIETKIREIKMEYEKKVEKIKSWAKKNRMRALKRAEEIILKWQ